MATVMSPWPLNSGLHHRLLPPPPSFYVSSQIYNHSQPPPMIHTTRPIIDKSSLRVSEAYSDSELWAAACLRARSFHNFPEQSFAVQVRAPHIVPALVTFYSIITQREFEAMKERIAGNNASFRKVTCINATLPLSQLASISDDLCDSCKFSEVGEDRVVVGTLDLNQCVRLPDEITGSKPSKGIGADFARAYLSNVCVASELHRNGLAYALIAKSKMVAEKWGISDLYVHVAIINKPAKNLYEKCGFVFENEEPAWQARFLDRPRRLLLWTGLPINYEL